MLIRVHNYGLATYLKMRGHKVEVIQEDNGKCVCCTEMEEKDFDSLRDEYLDSPFKRFDDASKALRDERNKICCPKY